MRLHQAVEDRLSALPCLPLRSTGFQTTKRRSRTSGVFYFRRSLFTRLVVNLFEACEDSIFHLLQMLFELLQDNLFFLCQFTLLLRFMEERCELVKVIHDVLEVMLHTMSGTDSELFQPAA